jgi:hypothetical protein
MHIELLDRTYFHLGRRVNANTVLSLLERDSRLRVLRMPQGMDVTDATKTSLLRKVWSDKEVETLRANFRSLPLKELAAVCLPNKSEGQIRHMASGLGLTEERDTWSPAEERALSILRKSQVCFEDIASILKRSRRACEVRAHSLGVTFPQKVSETGQPDGGRGQYSKLGTQAKGRLAETLVASQLTLNGIDVFEPFFPQHVVDLVAMRGNSFYKIQVKSGVWIPATARFRISLLRKNPRSHKRMGYDEAEVDFFIAVCLGANAIYVIPRAEAQGVAEINLYPNRETRRNGDGVGWERFRDAYSLIR